MTEYVVNEWLWADLARDNGDIARRETFETIAKFAASSDRLILVAESEFDRKAWLLCKSPDITTRRMGAAFIRLIRQNANRCCLVRSGDLFPLPAEISAAVKPDDHYLVQACRTFPGSVLVTTDRPLAEIVTTHGIACMEREEFVKTFS